VISKRNSERSLVETGIRLAFSVWCFPFPALSAISALPAFPGEMRGRLRTIYPQTPVHRKAMVSVPSPIANHLSPRSIFRAFTSGAHFNQARVEPSEHFDQIGLRSHYLGNVFVNSWHFVESGR
jgi:hypothetical protein